MSQEAVASEKAIASEAGDEPAGTFKKPPTAWFRRLVGSLVALLLLLAVLAIDGATSTSAAVQVQPIETEPLKGPIRSLQSLTPGTCYAFPLLEKPESEFLGEQPVGAYLAWTTSGIFHDNQMYVADLGFSRFAKVPIGGYVETAFVALPHSRGKKLEPLTAPWYVYPRRDPEGRLAGYVLLDLMDDSDSQVLFVNREGQVEDGMDTWGRQLSGPGRTDVVIIDVLRMVPAATGLVANADFMLGDDFRARRGREYWNAFAFLDRGSERDTYIPLAFDGDEDKEAQKELKEKYYGRDLAYFAVVNGTVFVLMMQDEPWIGRVDLERLVIERLPRFPADLKIPQFSIRDAEGEMIRGLDRLLKVYREIEGHAMPLGLYSWRDRLFVLAKGAADKNNGNTRWELVEVSPEDGRDLNLRVPLPTRAEHIALVLGEEQLGIIEKGPINYVSTSRFPWKELYRRTGSAVLFEVEPWLRQSVSDQDKVWQQCQEISVGQ